jgi:hypothetical protein
MMPNAHDMGWNGVPNALCVWQWLFLPHW